MPIGAARTIGPGSTPARRVQGSTTRTIGAGAAPRSIGAGASGSPQPALVAALGVSSARSKDLAAHSRPGSLPGPVNALIRAANVPNLAIGDAITNPSHIIRGGPSFRDLYNGKADSIGQAVEKRGALDAIPDKYGLRTATKLALDIGLDPTTYITFGAGGAVKAAGRGASVALTRDVAEAAARGERVSIQSVARSSAMREVDKAAAPRALSVGFRVPLSRGKTVTLAESRKAAAAGAKVADVIGSSRVGENLREVFLPAGSASKVAHRVGADVRRYGESEKRLVSKESARLDTAISKGAKAAGMSFHEANVLIAKSLDMPEKYIVPDALKEARDWADQIRLERQAVEEKAGTMADFGDSYISHLPANANEQRKLEKMFPQDPDRQFFFQKQRELPNLDAWEAAGLKPEYRVSRLLEVRGHASVDARVLKAFDEVADGLPGVTSPDVLRVKEMIRPAMTGHYAVREMQSFVNGVGSSWKALALLSPGYHSRNLQSDLVSAWWAGARNPVSFVQAAKVLRGGKGTIRIAGKVYSFDELVNLAEAAGAIRIGQAGKEIRQGLDVRGKGHGFKPSRPGQGKASNVSMKVGEAREDFTRMGVFIERLKAGDDALTAGKTVRDFLFDYGDVGRFVAAARRFWLPFITFPSKAIPMVGRVAVTRPGTIATAGKIANTLNEAAGSPDLSLLPQGARSSFAVPVPDRIRGMIGAPKDQALLFNPESVLSYGSLNMLDPKNPLRGVGGLLNPIPKSLIEGKTGYSFYFDGPGGKTVKSPAVINALARIGVPIPGGMSSKTNKYSGETSRQYSRNLDLALRLFPPFSQSAPLIPGGGSETTRLPYLKYFGGLSVSPYDSAKEAFYAEKNKDRK